MLDNLTISREYVIPFLQKMEFAKVAEFIQRSFFTEAQMGRLSVIEYSTQHLAQIQMM